MKKINNLNIKKKCRKNVYCSSTGKLQKLLNWTVSLVFIGMKIQLV